MVRARTLEAMSPGLLRVVERARRDPHERQQALAYLIDLDALRRAFHRLRKGAAVGVDGVTKEAYGRNLEANLTDLHGRLREMKYRHQPLRRIHVPKGKDQTRAIGISAVEDKIVQGALREILGAIYEQDFRECSHGFRPGRKAHDALRDLNQVARIGKLNVILEADVKSFFDDVDHPTLREMLQMRIADKSFMRLIGKCLRVGVLEGEEFSRPDVGTPQGSIISPILGNIYLHNVLDVWFEDEVKPRLAGEAKLIRYADDFIICFEHLRDAERVKVALEKRMERYKLRLHPDKTRLVEFRQPPANQKGGKGPGSLNFLGFTIFWRRNYKGNGWHLSWKTRAARQQRAIKALADYCRRHRHDSVASQHRGLTRRIQGHFNYFGVNDNVRSLSILREKARRSWYKWLNRRSQRSRLNWERFGDLLRDFPLPKPRVYVDLWR
jgi:group II intron reverse transcriptase/maturase